MDSHVCKNKSFFFFLTGLGFFVSRSHSQAWLHLTKSIWTFLPGSRPTVPQSQNQLGCRTIQPKERGVVLSLLQTLMYVQNVFLCWTLSRAHFESSSDPFPFVILIYGIL